MKTVTILLSLLVNDQGIVHQAMYDTQFENCYQAEQAALEHAFTKYVESGKASEVSIASCEPTQIEDFDA